MEFISILVQAWVDRVFPKWDGAEYFDFVVDTLGL